MANHLTLDGDLVDKVGWIQSAEPAGNSVIAGRCWIDTSHEPYLMKIRNSDNNAWIQIGTVMVTGYARVKYVQSGNVMTEYWSIDGGVTWNQIRSIALG